MQELLSSLRQLGIDKNGMIMDPMFADPENGNFQLDPSSPLLKNGFAPINQDEMGLTHDFPEKFIVKWSANNISKYNLSFTEIKIANLLIDFEQEYFPD